MNRFIAAAAIAVLLHAPAARAEPPARPADVSTETDHYEWHFDDDALNAVGTNPYGEWLGVRRPAHRVMLIRPRASFVYELLESIGRL